MQRSEMRERRQGKRLCQLFVLMMRAHCARCAIATAHRSDRAISEEF
jgi:hypothetical protein